MNVSSYADRAASVAAHAHLELTAILADGVIGADEVARLRRLARTLRSLWWACEWIAGTIALAQQVLRRGPNVPLPDKRLRGRLAELQQMTPAGLDPAEAVEPVETSSPLV